MQLSPQNKIAVVVLFVLLARCIAVAQTQHKEITPTSIQAVETFRTTSDKPKPIITPDYYTQHFGFFCKQELKLQRANIPLTFRLGNMNECNRLEQKRSNALTEVGK